jgi:homoserine kinase
VRFAVTVPASTSNLGPGFDALGLALSLYNDFFVETASAYKVEVEGEGLGQIPTDDTNLFLKAYRATMNRFGAEEAVRVRIVNRIPLGRGLGSSATAIVAGILAAKKVSGEEFSVREVAEIALELEPHLDNILPAYMGGLVVVASGDGFSYVRLNWPIELKVVVVVPELVVPTKKARSVLPDGYTREDVVFNIQRVALLVSALWKKDFSLLKEAVRDRIHQPYRSRLVPFFNELVAEGYRAGALAVYLSGAGSCVAAIVERSSERVASAMCGVLESAGVKAKCMELAVDNAGARLKEL